MEPYGMAQLLNWSGTLSSKGETAGLRFECTCFYR
jgi:hypothetical protein